MELTPSFKVKVLKEWSGVNGYLCLCIRWIICGANRGCRGAAVEGTGFSRKDMFICPRLNQYPRDNLFAEQGFGIHIAHRRVRAAATIGDGGGSIHKRQNELSPPDHPLPFPLSSSCNGL